MRLSKVDAPAVTKNLLLAWEGGADPAFVLDTLADVTVMTDYLRTCAVRDMRRAGSSWTQVGTALGISKQAAQQRYGG